MGRKDVELAVGVIAKVAGVVVYVALNLRQERGLEVLEVAGVLEPARSQKR